MGIPVVVHGLGRSNRDDLGFVISDFLNHDVRIGHVYPAKLNFGRANIKQEFSRSNHQRLHDRARFVLPAAVNRLVALQLGDALRFSLDRVRLLSLLELLGLFGLALSSLALCRLVPRLTLSSLFGSLLGLSGLALSSLALCRLVPRLTLSSLFGSLLCSYLPHRAGFCGGAARFDLVLLGFDFVLPCPFFLPPRCFLAVGFDLCQIFFTLSPAKVLVFPQALKVEGLAVAPPIIGRAIGQHVPLFKHKMSVRRSDLLEGSSVGPSRAADAPHTLNRKYDNAGMFCGT